MNLYKSKNYKIKNYEQKGIIHEKEKNSNNIIGSMWEHPKVCVNLQTDVR